MAPSRVAQPTQGTHFPCLSDRGLSYLGRPRRRLGSPSTGELVFHICTQITLSWVGAPLSQEKNVYLYIRAVLGNSSVCVFYVSWFHNAVCTRRSFYYKFKAILATRYKHASTWNKLINFYGLVLNDKFLCVMKRELLEWVQVKR